MVPFGKGSEYEQALSAERRSFDHCLAVHELPDIFHYWSETHLRPRALRHGFEDSTALFAARLAEQFAERLESDRRPRRFCSLGSGNGDLEIELAIRLRAAGKREFTFDCVDLNTEMRNRATAAAAKAGAAEHLRFIEGDLNHWTPSDEYDAVIANQSLHHILNLEGLLDEVKKALRPEGTFLISDIVGRNGHRRWPEALAIVQEYWKSLPPSYRVNLRTGRYDHEFEDWDCSEEGFEGVRAQDILPLLIQRFDFHFFFPFGNLIDPFIDRTFGPRFDRSQRSDREFIDEVQNRDTREIAAGNIKPTHMIAVAGTAPVPSPVFADGLTPRFCVRPPDVTVRKPAAPAAQNTCEPFLSTPERAAAEAGQLALMLRDLTIESETWKRAALRSEKNFEERTEWALSLDTDLKAASARVQQLESELAERTEWALRVEKERDSELKDRTAWALRLDNQLKEKVLWTEKLCEERRAQSEHTAALETKLGYVRRPWKLLKAALSAAHRNRNAKTARSAGAAGE
jgi:SAM-dependent methyltransferase